MQSMSICANLSETLIDAIRYFAILNVCAPVIAELHWLEDRLIKAYISRGSIIPDDPPHSEMQCRNHRLARTRTVLEHSLLSLDM